jgi:hypothetical protein
MAVERIAGGVALEAAADGATVADAGAGTEPGATLDVGEAALGEGAADELAGALATAGCGSLQPETDANTRVLRRRRSHSRQGRRRPSSVAL